MFFSPTHISIYIKYILITHMGRGGYIVFLGYHISYINNKSTYYTQVITLGNEYLIGGIYMIDEFLSTQLNPIKN